MFLDEARLAAALNHQNVAQVFEVGQENGVHYLAMEYVHGQDLRAVLAKAGQSGARIPIELSLAIVAGAAAGLHHAHDRRSPDGVPLGIVHRDVSPSNVMIGYDGAVKLLDFGIAKATSRSVETQSGIIKGKFAYMSPEQCRGREVDRRSDVFSLGIILYEITTQHRCFRADSDFDTMHRIVTGDVVRPSRLVATYPQELEKIVMTALAVDPARRFASCAAMLEQVEDFAAYARLSPSTMALGRFMRELFGEVPEPWQAGGRANALAAPARENTVSNTLDSQSRFSNGEEDSDVSPHVQIGEAPAAAAADRRESWSPKEPSLSSNTWAAKASSRARGAAMPSAVSARPAPSGAAQTLLDLPRGGQESEDAVDWDAKAYPQAQPTFASQLEVPVERKPSLHGIVESSLSQSPTGRTPSSANALRTTGPRRAHGTQGVSAAHSQPSMAVRSATSMPMSTPQMTPLSDKTSPATPATALPITVTSFTSMEASSEKLRAESVLVNVRPQRRLVIGVMIAVLIVAFAALIIIAWGGDDVDTASTEATTEATTEAHGEPNGDPGSAAAPAATPPPSEPSAPSGSAAQDPGAAANGAVPTTDAAPSPPVAPTAPNGGAVAESPSTPASTPPSNPPSNPIATAPSTPSTELRTVESTLHLQVTSDPKGADVYLAGKRLGVTPLSVFLPKRSGSAVLAVRRQRFVEATAKIDLSSAEVTKAFSLRHTAAERSKDRGGSEAPVEEPAGKPEPARERPCQRPESANPFDETPICTRQ
jgi:eukaryotic-like serine/threonine-protein kinase